MGKLFIRASSAAIFGSRSRSEANNKHFDSTVGIKGKRPAKGSCFVVGIPSLVAAAGGPGLDLTLMGIALTAVLWWYRHRICEDDVPAFLALITLAIVYGHDLDFVYLAPLAVSLTLHLRGRPRGGLVVAALLAVFFIPSRLICQFGHPVIDQWRTLIALFFLGWLLWMSTRDASIRVASS